MCGRFSRIQGVDILKNRYSVQVKSNFPPSYNIAPKQMVPVISQTKNDLLQMMQWGLVPWWSKTKIFAYDLINIRDDKIFSNKTSRTLIKTNRCLIPATGFYEWKKGTVKQPYHFTVKDMDVISFAGISSTWKSGDDTLNSFAIITTSANSIVAKIHDRMPVILKKNDESAWLSSDLTNNEIESLLTPFASDKMDSIRVSTKVNNVINNSPELLIPEDNKVKQTSLTDFF